MPKIYMHKINAKRNYIQKRKLLPNTKKTVEKSPPTKMFFIDASDFLYQAALEFNEIGLDAYLAAHSKCSN